LIKKLQAERGAVAVLAAISMLMIMAAVALSFDIGNMVWRQRQIQGVVDLASLDAVRALSDRRDPTLTRCAQALTYARQAAARNNFDYSLSGYSLSVQLGTVNASTKAWSMLSDCTSNLDPSTANAVKVTASRPVVAKFLPGSDNVLGNAIASNNPEATIGMGTWAARVNTSYTSQFDKIITCMGKGGGTCSSSAGLTVAGYSGLANATINMGSLFTSLGIGTANDIANTQVSYKNMLTAAATILNTQGGATNVAAATALGTLAASADSTLKFKFGDFIDASTGYADAAAANVNVLELVGTSVEVANTAHFVEVDNLGLTVPGVSNLNLKMSVIEAPVWKTGPVGISVHTAQIRTQLEMSVGSVLVGVTQVPITLKLYVESANGTGTLTNVACAANPSNGSVTINASTSAVTLYIGEVSNGAMTNVSVDPTPSAAVLANVAGLVKITGSGSLSLAGANNASVVLSGPFTRSGTVGTFTTNTDALRNNLTLVVTSLGLPLNVGAISTATANLVKPVLDVVDTTILNVLDAMPGISLDLAGADLWNTNVNCGSRRLVG
jgi:uncharacterized membrane protein